MKVTTTIHNNTPIDPDASERAWITGLLRQDKLAEAARYSETLIKDYPRSFLLFYTLGMSWALLAEYQKALDYLQRAVVLNSGVADAWGYLGDCCIKQDRNEDACNAYIKALALAPDHLASRRGLAQAMIDPTRFSQSVENIETLVADDPENPHLHLVLGQCYFEQEKYNRAIRHLEKAAELLPDDAVVMTLVDRAYAGFHKPKEAMAWFRKAEQKERLRPELLMMMANAAKDDGDFDQSIRFAEQAIALNPQGAASRNELAKIHSVFGDRAKAIDLREQVLKDHPDDLGAIIGLAYLKKVERGSPLLTRLRDRFRQHPDNYFAEKTKMNIGFALGKAYGDTSQFAKAVKALKYANARRRQIIEYNFDDEIRYFDLIKRVFDPITPADYATPSPDDRRMIFIIGMPRSGTTLTERIISSHSAVYGAGELNFINEETAEMMYMFGLQPDVILRKVAFEHIRPKYLNHIESLCMKERVITDKLPHNFLRVGFILCCFPESHTIHLNRDLAAVCFSCFQKFFPARGMGFTFDLSDLGRYYAHYLDLMEFWRQKFPGRIMELDYRTLTEDQENQTRILLDHCGLPWEDQCLEFYNTKRGVLTASQTQVREKMYQGSSEVWKKYRKYIPELLDELDKAGVKYG